MRHLRIMSAFAMLIFGAQAQAADEERTVAFEVEKMTCATCPITVRAAMQRVDGVKTVKVDLATNTATVTYDANVTNASDIAGASTNVGFPATVVEEGGE